MISMVGVLLLAVIVLTPSISPFRLDQVSKIVASDIEYAKQNAITTGQTSGVEFISGGNYTVYQNTTATPLIGPLNEQSMIISISTLFPGASITSNYTVEFDKFGKPTTGGGAGVTISDGSNTKTVFITANTGRITIQ